MARVTFDGYEFAVTRFGTCDLHGVDLRGQDLSSIVGIASLEGAVVAQVRLIGLNHAVVAELDLIVKG